MWLKTFAVDWNVSFSEMKVGFKSFSCFSFSWIVTWGSLAEGLHHHPQLREGQHAVLVLDKPTLTFFFYEFYIFCHPTLSAFCNESLYLVKKHEDLLVFGYLLGVQVIFSLWTKLHITLYTWYIKYDTRNEDIKETKTHQVYGDKEFNSVRFSLFPFYSFYALHCAAALYNGIGSQNFIR